MGASGKPAMDYIITFGLKDCKVMAIKSTEYRHKLESMGYIFVADSVDLKNFRGGFRKNVMAVHGHPRSLISVPIETRKPSCR